MTHSDERGANLVELALVSFLLLLMLGGVADIGRSFNNYIILTNASREGVRYASRFPRLVDENGIKQAAIQEAADSGMTLSVGDILIENLGASSGDWIRVTVTYQFPTIMGGVIGVGNLTLRNSTEMVIFGLDG